MKKTKKKEKIRAINLTTYRSKSDHMHLRRALPTAQKSSPVGQHISRQTIVQKCSFFENLFFFAIINTEQRGPAGI